MTAAGSGLYVGRVGHTRLRPFRHSFEYRIFTLLVDLDELDRINSRLRLFSHNRFNLFGLADADHGGRDGRRLRTWIDEQLASAGIDLAGGRVLLLAFPRVLGYTFDPLTIWYCYDADGRLRALLHEVKNTFGEQHGYLVPTDGTLRHQFEKSFFVSPYMDMEAHYEFAMNGPGEHLSVGITMHDREGPILRAALRGHRVPLTDGNLLRLFFTHPLLTLKVIGAIHWQGLLIWRKGAPYRTRPPVPRLPVEVVAPHQVAV
jgi:DUF1365 family protein